MSATLRCFVVDAFTSKRFSGNPADVVPLEAWPSDDVLAAVAAEMNLSETAFFARDGAGADYRLRWFTPRVEVDLCGHATLASAHVLLRILERAREDVRFFTKSGPLIVRRAGDALTMDLPARPPSPIAFDSAITAALGGAPPVAMLRARDVVLVYDDAKDVRDLAPDMAALAKLDGVFGVCVTAPGAGVDGGPDFVSRFFAPAKGVPEDPVTGSTHCTLAPYWASRLGKTTLRAKQLSWRGGELVCALEGDRVALIGDSVLVLDGTLHVA